MRSFQSAFFYCFAWVIDNQSHNRAYTRGSGRFLFPTKRLKPLFLFFNTPTKVINKTIAINSKNLDIDILSLLARTKKSSTNLNVLLTN